ncbi:tetratricopeptide repeat protein [Paludibaculum fermentans]|uniref:Peptidase MA-like domain-containing protein n=1 Tax=Paludibaculum fermentans TaxID=1473598 RepID=A0A7S7SLQ0_PALFE|nr:tetratricopeptide repeat protein [Paludibaculum fermentans]QOY89078.1 hypothetical protein IRI77_03720 [Paludibaculum fermentans]
MPEKATEPARLRIVAFSSESEYQVFRLNSYSPAYFVGGSGQGTIVLGRLAKETLPALRHEYIHALVHENGWNLPLWLAEGLAEQFAGVDAARVRYRRNLLKRQGFPDIQALKSVHSALQDQSQALTFYAASWALTNLLLTEPPYRDHFRAFLTSPEPQMAALLAASGRTVNQLQADLAGHIERLKTVSPNEGTAPIPVKCTVAPAPDRIVQIALARLLERSGDVSGARARLEPLAELIQDEAEYWVLMGDLAMLDSPVEDALHAYVKAMDLGSLDSRMLQRLAVLRQGQAEAVPVLERLLQVTPENDDARLVLSSHYVNEQRWPEALEQLRQVKHAPPEREDFYRRAVAMAESHLELRPVFLSTR